MIARPVAIAAVVAAIALLAVPAQADPDARTQAAAHVRQGQAYFQRGDFDRALAEYQAALELSAEPSLIFNMALCHDRANRAEEALKAFQRYLELAPNGSVAEEARADIARLTPIVEKIVGDRATEDARQREAAARRAEAAARRAEAFQRAEALRRRVAEAKQRVLISRYVIAAGGMVVAGGAIANLLGVRTRDRIIEDDRDTEAYLRDRHTLVIERDVTYGAYAVGGVALATGLVLALIARRSDEGPQLSAAVIPGGATMTVAWSR